MAETPPAAMRAAKSATRNSDTSARRPETACHAIKGKRGHHGRHDQRQVTWQGRGPRAARPAFSAAFYELHILARGNAGGDQQATDRGNL